MASSKRTPASKNASKSGKQAGSHFDGEVSDDLNPDSDRLDSDAGKSTWRRWLISIALAVHLMAIAMPPMMFQSGGSAIVATLLTPLRAYTEFLYLDRGYAFFAPDPGPSHLIEAAVTQSDGQRIETKYPDRQQQWPRLLYHRHFMLSEYLTEVYFPPGPPRELFETDRAAAEEWARLRLRYEHVRQSIVNHLRHQNGDKPVAIRRIEHLIPSAQEFHAGDFALNDPLLYDVMLDQPIVTGPPPMGPPETIPPPTAVQDLTAPNKPAETQAEKSTVESAEKASDEVPSKEEEKEESVTAEAAS